LHQFWKTDAIGGHYCIENEMDVIVIHVDAIGMTYRIILNKGCNRYDTFGRISIDFFCNMLVVLHRFIIWIQLESTIATDLCLM
jgi:hypothetical protein